MRNRVGAFCGVVMALAFGATALAQGEADLAAQSRAGMAKATGYIRSIATEGGYLWRYSADLSRRAGENVATATQIWIQPPGTPAVGMAMLRAYEATREPRYLAAARDAADALARGQLESGGWNYMVEFDPAQRGRYRYRIDTPRAAGGPTTSPAPSNVSTYDDNNTQSVLRFLLALVDVIKTAPADPRDGRIRETLEYGLKQFVAGQYPIGAWPQRWDGTAHDPKTYPVLDATIPTDYPRTHPNTSYMGFYTLNDNTQRDCIQTLMDAHRRTGKAEYLEAARRGADFLVRAQLPAPQAGWSQQYNPAMQPAWARAFEPPCVTSSEGAAALNLLIDMYLQFGDAKYLQRVPEAIAWFRKSEISPGVWARMYELGSNKPIYGDRDGKIHYTLAELSEERRTGYSWQGNYGIPAILERAEGVMKVGRDTWQADHTAKPPTAEEKATRARGMEGQVRQILSQLDDQGRWMSTNSARPFQNQPGPWVDLNRFNANMNTLCQYLELVAK